MRPPPATRATTRLRPRSGGSAIEFAILLPVFLGLVGCFFEYGAVFHLRATAAAAAAAGCRAGASTDPDFLPPEDVALAETRNHLERSAIGAECAAGSGCEIIIRTRGAAPAELLVCTVAFEYEGIAGFFPMPDRVGATATAMIEREP